MRVIKTLGYQMRMASSHIFTGIFVGPAECHSQEGFLLGGLFVHVDATEKALNPIILQNFAIKNVYSGVDGGFTPDFIIQAHSQSFR
jgi:hypothetical protein